MTTTVYIAKNVYGGDGLGRLGDGRVVFVPGAWAGEQVKAEIVEERRSYVKARLVEVVEGSPDRIECDAGRVMPGMVYAKLSYAGEMKAKEQEARASVVQAEAEVPKAMAEAFRSGNLGIMDYYKMQNIQADTSMREAIAKPKTSIAHKK